MEPGTRVKCINDEASNDLLKKGEIYEVGKDHAGLDNKRYLPIKIPGLHKEEYFFCNRFERVALKKLEKALTRGITRGKSSRAMHHAIMTLHNQQRQHPTTWFIPQHD